MFRHFNTLLIFTILLAVAVMTVAGVSEARVLFHETFDGTSEAGGTVYGGQFPAGYDSLGWTSTLLGRESPVPEYVEYDLPLGFFGEEGTIEFYFMRSRANPSGDRLDGVFTIIGEGHFPLLKIVIEWDSLGTYFNGNSVIHLGTDPLVKRMAGGPWGGTTVSLGSPITVNEWNHLAISWGLDKKDNRIFLNGKPLAGKALRGLNKDDFAEEGVTVGAILMDAETLRIGAEAARAGETTYTYSPMADMVIDEFKIHDVAFNPLDPPPIIQSVFHNAFEVAGYSGKLVEGDTLNVNLKGDPGITAAFDIGEDILGVSMVEDPENPGTYVGTYKVSYGVELEGVLVTGRMLDTDGEEAEPVSADRPVNIDSTVYLSVQSSNDLIPADRSSRTGLTIVATDANGKAIQDHELKLTMSTTDEYTGTVGGGSFEDLVGGSVDVDWGGVTDSFGEVTAQYIAGFAAKTIMVSAKDMVNGDVGVGWVRSYIDGSVDIVVKEPVASALAVAGSMDISLSRNWLTADGKSRSRITAVVKDASGVAVSGHTVRFTLLGSNGEIRVIQSKTDSRGRALADYIAGTVMGQVQVEVRDLTSGLTAIASIELRPDAPAEIVLAADPAEIVTGGESMVTARVTDANGNPNRNVDVLYDVSVGEGAVSAPSVATDEKGNATVTFTAADTAGLVTVHGTVISREPTSEEIAVAQGAVFLYGLEEDPGRLEVVEWLVKAGDEVVKGQEMVTLEDRSGTVYTIKAPRDGIVATFTAEEKDQVQYGDTLGYVIEIPE